MMPANSWILGTILVLLVVLLRGQGHAWDLVVGKVVLLFIGSWLVILVALAWVRLVLAHV